MNEQCIVIGNGVLMPKYIAEDDIPRDGADGRNTPIPCLYASTPLKKDWPMVGCTISISRKQMFFPV